MTWESTLTWSYLSVLTKRRYDALKQVYGDLDAPLNTLNENMLRELGMKEEPLRETLVRLAEFDAKIYEEALEKAGVCLLSIEDEAYPPPLLQLPDPPIFLTYRGDLSCLDQPLLGVVGTRAMSPYGRRVAAEFVPGIVRAGVVTISGLALGIDARVAEETLSSGGRTVAVLGGGLGDVRPLTNAALAERIVEGGGLLLSEFPLDRIPSIYTFPARNRIIAGLSLGCLVLEAPAESGALITAELALDYGRDVFAVPGQAFDPNYLGCHKLVASGRAKLVTHPDDVLEELGIVIPPGGEPMPFVAATPEEGAVHSLLTTLPQPIDHLVERSGMPSSIIAGVLTMLELKGVARNVGTAQWVRT